MRDWRDARRGTVAGATATTILSLFLGLTLTQAADVSPSSMLPAVLAGLMVPTLAALSVLRRCPLVSTPADLVTLLRAVLAGGCATLVTLSLMGELPLRSWPLFLLALPAFLLDGVDGWVARRTGTVSPAGGRLDMETDAIFLVILSIPLALSVGPWVLVIGAMRYLFLAAAWWRSALRERLAFSQFRRVVAGIQGLVLVAAVMPTMPVAVAAVATGVALLLLVISFGRDVITLERAGSGLCGRMMHDVRRGRS